MKTKTISLLFLLGLAAPVFAAEAGVDVSLKNFPVQADSEKGFVPNGWNLEKSAKGDLNKDSIDDIVVTAGRYVHDKEAGFDRDIARVVIVAFGNQAGKFRKVAASDHIARLSGDSGTMGSADGAHVDIKIERGVFTIENMWGSREAQRDTYRFRYDSKSNKFQLIGKDVFNFDRGAGDQKLDSRNLLTGDRIVELSKIDDKGNTKILSKKLSKIKKQALLTFEQVAGVPPEE